MIVPCLLQEGGVSGPCQEAGHMETRKDFDPPRQSDRNIRCRTVALDQSQLNLAMLRVALHNKVSTVLCDRQLLGDLRTTGACYTEDGVAEPMDDPNPSFCVRHTPLDTLDLSDQHLSVELSTALASAFQANPSFRYVNLSSSNLVERLDLILPVLSCPKLKLYSLNLSFCKLGSVGLTSVANALLSMAVPLSELSLIGNDLSANDISLLSTWLETNRGLKLLDLGMNPRIGQAGLQALTKGLSRAGHPLQSLGLSGTGLDDTCADVLSELVLDPAFKAEFFDISWNILGLANQGNVTSVLGRIQSVRELHAMSMKMGLMGYRRLLESLKGSSNIEVLHLSSNYGPSELAPDFIQVLPTLTNLRWLEVTSNGFDVPFLHALTPTLSMPSKLSILSFSNCDLQDAGAYAFATILSSSTTLLELHFSLNQMTDSGAIAIAEVLQTRNNSLQNLRLDENEIGPEGINALLAALQHNSTLRYLDISENDFDPADYQNLSFPNAPSRVVRLLATEL